MANQPFDQRIINPLERPTSQDLNQAQSQLNTSSRALLRWIYAPRGGFAPNGALGNSFQVVPVSGMQIKMRVGINIVETTRTEPTQENIERINGLNDIGTDHIPRFAYLSTDKFFNAAPAPAAGLCRRDIIAIRPRKGDELLKDQVDTDIYEPSINAFQSAQKFKTASWDLIDEEIEFIDEGGTPTKPIVYVRGNTVAYVDEGTFYGITPPALSGYNNIAVINMKPEVTAITAGDIVDFRRMAAPYGNFVISGSARVGSDGTNVGEFLDDVVINTPPGITASIYKAGADLGTPTNTFVLAVFGPRAVAAGDLQVTVDQPSSSLTGARKIYPTLTINDEITVNSQVTPGIKAIFADPSKAYPTQNLAIGQPVHFFPFTVGTVEEVAGVPTPITIPATYNSQFLPFYLDWGVAADSPTTGLPDPTWRMNNSTTGVRSTPRFNLQPVNAYTRQAAFVSPVELTPNMSVDAGTVWTMFLPLKVVSFVEARTVSMFYRVYEYDGLTDPELGTPITQSEIITLGRTIQEGDSDSSFLPVPLGIDATLPSVDLNNKRLFVAIYMKNDIPGPEAFWVDVIFDHTQLQVYTKERINDEYIFTIPSAGGLKFNPSATTFEMVGAIVPTRNVPVNFSVNLKTT